jgi:hypothetical protein
MFLQGGSVHIRTLDYNGHRIEATADQDHDLIWMGGYKIDPEPEILHTGAFSRAAQQFPTRQGWSFAEDALTAAIAEARAVVDAQILKDKER